MNLCIKLSSLLSTFIIHSLSSHFRIFTLSSLDFSCCHHILCRRSLCPWMFRFHP